MGISTEGDWGTGAHATLAASFSFNTATSALTATGVGLLVVATDNISPDSGETNLHTGVSGGAGTWTKLGEYTNGNGAAAAGVTTSLWLFNASGAVAVGTGITITLAEAVVDKACSGHAFTRDADKLLRIVPGTFPQYAEVDAAAGFGASTISGLASKQYLFIRALGKEANSTGNITPTSSYGTFAAARSRNDANAILVRGERRVVTATSQTSNPTFSVVGDGASVFVALEEYVPTGNPVGSGGGAIDTVLSGAGKAKAKGAAQVTGGLVLSGPGRAIVEGTGAGSFGVALAGSGQVGPRSVSGAGAGNIGVSLSGTGRLVAKGLLTISVGIGASGSGRAKVTGAGAAAIGTGLAGQGAGVDTRQSGQGSAEIAVALLGFGRVPAKGAGAATAGVNLSATGSQRQPSVLHTITREGHWRSLSFDGVFNDAPRDGVWMQRERAARWA